ncbi:hypothetical protein [Streptomyces justiciae]|uniref:hypothetical protein n=1 Tax=Streptomyces justiciae TaxID=2780140 RepID=UPI002118E930|nr:hypothetical protein [Streptomyces justiciae]MCW8384345.1 hypothetical protein [Streptomyces justiciae]
MSGWNGNGNGGGYSSGSDEHEPSEERGQAAWGAQGQSGALPPWASAETQTSYTPPSYTPPWGAPPPPPVQPQPYVQPPPPPPPGPRRLLVILTAMVVLGSGIGAGVWFLTRDGGVGADATPGPNVVVTTSAPTQATPSVSTLESPPASPSESLPASPTPAPGYRLADDPVGYSIVVPEGWTRRQKQGEKAPVVFYDAPDDGRQLQIFRLAEDSPAESLHQAENDPGFGFARQPGYQALERDEDTTWSELTYRYDDEDKGARQVIDHRFEAADGTYYAIRASGPEGVADALVREPLTMALGSFCPADVDCG